MSFSNLSTYSLNKQISNSTKSACSDESYCDTSSSYSSQHASSLSSMNVSDKRKSRNENEKNRRDQFNVLIQELGSLLNHPRKIDKATVLHEAIYFFKNYKNKPLYNKEIGSKWKPFFMQNDEFMRFMIDFENAFCLVFDLSGQIKYVSDDIMQLLGHHPKSIENSSLFELVDEKSSKSLKSVLEKKFSHSDPISFDCKFRKVGSQNSNFELIKVKGFFKLTPNSSDSIGHFNTIAKLDLFMRINEIYPRDNFKKDFVFELSMDWKFTSLDSKASEIIGYIPIEVLGTSCYDYIHHDDLDKLVNCHKKLIQSDQTPIKVPYRFRTKGLQWLWIHTKFQIINNQSMNPKTYSIRGFSEVIGINEILSNKEILESSSSKKSHNSTSMVTNDLTEKDFLLRSSSTNALNDVGSGPFEGDVLYNSRVVKSNSSTIISMKSSEFRKDTNKQVTFMEHGSSSNNLNPLEKSEKNSENKIDQNLGNIFLRSYSDLNYRNYVIDQLKRKKSMILNNIKEQQDAIQEKQAELEKIKSSLLTKIEENNKQQEELKILEETIYNISDDKKLGSWVMEFNKLPVKSTLTPTPAINNDNENLTNSLNVQSPTGDLIQSILPSSNSADGQNSFIEINQDMIDKVFNNFYE